MSVSEIVNSLPENQTHLTSAALVLAVGHQVIPASVEESSDFGKLPNGRQRSRPPLSYSDVNEFNDSYHTWIRSSLEERNNFNWPVPIDSETFFDLYEKDRTTLRRYYQDTDFSQQFILAASRQLSLKDQHEVVDYLVLDTEPRDTSMVIIHLQCSEDFRLTSAQTTELLGYHNGYYSKDLLSMLHKVTVTDINSFALQILESDDWWSNPAVEKYLLGHLEDIDHKAVTDRMLHAGTYGMEYLIGAMEYFDCVDEAALMSAVLGLSSGLTKIHQNLYKFHHVTNEVLQQLSEHAGYPVTAYPHGASEKIRNRWFAEQAYTYLDGGFSKDMIGKVIRLRTEPRFEVVNGRRVAIPPIASNLHDASQWLTDFKKPFEAYDLAYIKAHRDDPNFDPEFIETRHIYDNKLEGDLLVAIMNAPLAVRQSLALSSKPETVLQLSDWGFQQQIYFTLTQPDASGQLLYKSPDLSWDMLRDAMNALDETYRRLFTEQGAIKRAVTTSRSTKDKYPWDTLSPNRTTFEHLAKADPGLTATSSKIRSMIGELKSLGLRRKAYVDDAATWLVRHATTPHDLLVKTWGDRPLALANGFRDNNNVKIANVQDKASDIKRWQIAEGTRLVLRQPEVQARLAKVGLTKHDISGPGGKIWREELTRKLSAEQTVEAFIKYQKWTKGSPKSKVLAPAQYESNFNESLGRPAWRLEILAPNDPRGFTIGPDTGCCMTINGASKDCIKAGYRNPNAGFLALYGPDGKINAQSFWFVHPNYPDTLVLDNIEANKGRDFQNITSIYEVALRFILAHHNADHLEQPITRVHVGEGYTDVKIGHLPSAAPIPKLSSNIYSDANKQRILFTL